MAKSVRTSVVLISDEHPMGLGEFCRCCDVAADELLDMVREGMLQPQGDDPRQWRFSAQDLARVRTAVRLQRDLGTNLAGAALALELIEEMQDLRARLRLLEQLLR